MSMRSRRIAMMLTRHAARTLPFARSSWAEAMWREFAYIDDDRAALDWAIGCVMTSYKIQLVALLRFFGRVLSRPILAGGMLLSIALALAHASDLAKKPDCEQAKTVETSIDPGGALEPPCVGGRQPHHFTAKDRSAQ